MVINLKNMLKIGAVFTVLVAIIPMLAFFEPYHAQAPSVMSKDDTIKSYTENNDKSELEKMPDYTEYDETRGETKEIEYSGFYDGSEEFTVLDFTSGQVVRITMKDYIIGAVLAEMPASFHPEALKAQAVAAHTYAKRQKEKQLLMPDIELLGAYISNDSTKYQAYFTTEQAKDFYGEAYEEYYEKISEAVTGVIGKVLYYDGEPIVAAFHSTSGGKTESAEVIWGNHVEYLIPVDSEHDTDSPAYLEEKTFSSDEMKSLLTSGYNGISLEKDPSEWFEILEKSGSGTVINMKAGSSEISGTDFRSLLGLRSAVFTVGYNDEDDIFTVTTKGYGHGVGLSQYGANAMANEGFSYDEILMHYYPGTELRDELQQNE